MRPAIPVLIKLLLPKYSGVHLHAISLLGKLAECGERQVYAI
jgi:hypothetical protein